MDPKTYGRVKEIFLAAQERPESEWSGFVAGEAGGDQDIHNEVMSLLGHVEADPVMIGLADGSGPDTRNISGSRADLDLDLDLDPLRIEGETIDGRYRLSNLVGEGGFGYVYRAQHVLWKRPVAIKLFKQSGTAEDQAALRDAFVKEASILNDLSRQTNTIVHSYDVGTWESPLKESWLFTVLEWLEGETLAQQLSAARKRDECWGWSLQQVVQTLEPIAAALAIAHKSGVAHRDIKPSNIFLVAGKDDAPATIKLLDFGVAKVAADVSGGFEKTASQLSAFTMAYAAPEQMSKQIGPSGPWTDVYALASVCVELMLGKHPTRGSGVADMVSVTCDADRRPTPRACGVKVTEDVEAVFQRALALKPSARYNNAQAFWDALGATLKSDTRTHKGTTAAETRTWPRTLVWPVASVALFAGLWITLGDRSLGSSSTAQQENRPPVLAASSRPAPIIHPERRESFPPLPSAVTVASNPITDEKIMLGRKLFWDPILSRNQDRSCASCHDLSGFGIAGDSLPSDSQDGKRDTPSLYNCALAASFNWDGAGNNLEEQSIAPLFDPRKMGMTEPEVLRRLQSEELYRDLFANAFPAQEQPVTIANLGRALGAFERLLLTPAPWDDFLRGDENAISDAAKAGFNTFVDVGCVSCHHGPAVGLTMHQKLGLVVKWPITRDRGLFEHTKIHSDWMVFRVPSLRNVEQTSPYFHDGSTEDLDTAIHLMARHQLGKELAEPQVASIRAWLATLTGRIPKELAAEPNF